MISLSDTISKAILLAICCEIYSYSDIRTALYTGHKNNFHIMCLCPVSELFLYLQKEVEKKF